SDVPIRCHTTRPPLLPSTTLFRSRPMKPDSGLPANSSFGFAHAADGRACFQPLHIGADIRIGVQGNLRRDGPVQHDQSVAVDDRDRKSTRLNSSHVTISYAVFCLK